MPSFTFAWDKELVFNLIGNCKDCPRLKACGYLSKETIIECGSTVCQRLIDGEPPDQLLFNDTYTEEDYPEGE